MDDQVQNIPIDQVVDPWILLRPVLEHSVDYIEMETSISEHGFLCSISVRPCPRRSGKFEVIDGMYRFTCAKALNLEQVPAIIKHGLTDEDVLALQISANAIRPKTKPCEFARQLRRIQKAQPGISMGRLASMVNKSKGWVGQQLGLLRMAKHIQTAIDRGEICLQNAYYLSKIPHSIRENYVRQARAMKSREFGPLATAVLKSYQEAKAQGRRDDFYTNTFTPHAHLRSLKEVEEEASDRQVGPMMVTKTGCKNALEGWYAALQWMMHLDEDSVRKQEDAARGRQRKRSPRRTE